MTRSLSFEILHSSVRTLNASLTGTRHWSGHRTVMRFTSVTELAFYQVTFKNTPFGLEMDSSVGMSYIFLEAPRLP